MSLPFALHKVLRIVAAAGAAGVIYAGFRWLITHGSRSATKQRSTVYDLRPRMRLLAYLFVLTGCGLAWAAMDALRAHNSGNAAIYACVAVVSLAGGLFILSCRMVIDDTGLHYSRWPRQHTTIPWSSLTHYEVMSSSRAASRVYYFRSSDGETIGVIDTAFEASDLLRRVRARSGIEQQPYTRRHWYGG